MRQGKSLVVDNFLVLVGIDRDACAWSLPYLSFPTKQISDFRLAVEVVRVMARSGMIYLNGAQVAGFQTKCSRVFLKIGKPKSDWFITINGQ